MRKIQLSRILGVHPETARMELELDLAPIKLPDREIIPYELVEHINVTHPLIVVGEEDYYCIGRTTLYRWMVAHMPANAQALCLDYHRSYSKENIRKHFLTERLVDPALSQATPQQVRILHEYVSKNKGVWPHQYRSNAHLSKLLGLKPLKGSN